MGSSRLGVILALPSLMPMRFHPVRTTGLAVALALILGNPVHAASITSVSPQGEVAQVRQLVVSGQVPDPLN